MERLLIEKTKKTPIIDFNTKGILKFEGRFILEETSEFFKPLFQWAEDFTLNEAIVCVNLEYLNTSAAKHIFQLLRIIEEKEHVTGLRVKWYYEEDDEEHLDIGNYFEENLKKASFDYYCETFSEVE